MTFRPATADDVDFFWYWRERAEAQRWYGGKRTTRAEHDAWFLDRLGRITLLVWEDVNIRGEGIVRIDSNGELAFDATHPRSMLEEFVAEFGHERWKVTLDEDDRVKCLALKEAGFLEYPVRFFAYRP